MYPIGHKCLPKESKFICLIRTALGKTPVWCFWIVAILLLIFAGITYRVLASKLELITKTPIMLPVPLRMFPTQVGNWSGIDVPIPPNVQRIAGNDDYLNRQYTNTLTNSWADIYVAYTARPRTMIGHRPEICYVGGGWIHDSTLSSEVMTRSGRTIPCSIHRFHWPSAEGQELVVLNFYIVNGQVTADESVFTGVGWRTPNIAGNLARYVAQVQISSILENSVRSAAKDMIHLIFEFFPDENGIVRVMDYQNATSGVLK